MRKVSIKVSKLKEPSEQGVKSLRISDGSSSLEMWKDIEGYIGLYQISDQGKVKSVKRNVNIVFSFKKGGYLEANLHMNGKQTSYGVHRLVAKHFIRNLSKKSCVNHIDFDKKNNHVNNLEWVTYKENSAHAVLAGHYKKIGERGEKSVLSRLDDRKVLYVRSVAGKISQRVLAKKFGVSKTLIGSIIRRHHWNHI